MRVITGSARGVPLSTLPGEELVRPTAQRVKEALFSAIQFEIEGRRALDAFAGSGQLGIEALSRGAASCVFIENNRGAVKILKKNIEKAGLAEGAKVLQADAMTWLRREGEAFDLVFLDPPYGNGLLQEALALVSVRVAEGGAVLCEAPLREAMPGRQGNLLLERSYQYGKTKIFLYRASTRGE
ncbi:MAG: 16S rRNA (guanine(966)-N(2))-methyltransferase RsmD [Oscillospiraceae bacterium]|nr:16S rRNA (guanine(966)-N(2))-methyltransferase RsmD [Oscillospiraceae bacterium]